MTIKREIGDFGEDFACKKLKRLGMTVLERNFSAACGEIDIIAKKDDILAFIEVKTRTEGFLYEPIYAVTRQKQQKIIRTAQCYLMKNPLELQPRFDVFEVILKAGTKHRVQEYHYIENAFW